MTTTNTTKKIAVTGGALAAAVALIYHFFFVTTGFSGVYGNKVGTWITTEAGRKAEVAWLMKQGFKSDYLYGIDGSYLSSATNRANISDFILKYRRAGGQEVGFVLSKPSSLTYLEAYQKTATDSTRFNVIVTEFEQYNTGDRVGFAALLSACRKTANAYNMKLYSYQGWPNAADCDTIAKYADGVLLHAYGQYDKQSNLGAWCYGYMKTRNEMIATSFGKLNKVALNSMIVSTENPDQTKTQFGYKYFTTHNWLDTYNAFSSYYNSNASANMKKWIVYRGQQTFVEDQAKLIKP